MCEGKHDGGDLQASLGEKEPSSVDAAAAAARKTTQGQMQHLYKDSLVSQRSELVLVEGMAIRESLQEKVGILLAASPPQFLTST